MSPEATVQDLTSRSFVGRRQDVVELSSSLDEAIAGRGRLFLISGEPGIGKTWLADEVARHAAARRMRVAWGRCWEGGGAPPYWPWVQVLRSVVVHPERTRARPPLITPEIGQLIPELSSETNSPPPSDPDQARFRLFDGIATMLKDAARSQPLLLIFDDLHEADQSSLEMLKFIARGLRDSQIVVIGNYRDTEVRRSQTLSEAIAELLREGVQIPLAGLAETEVARMVEARAALVPSASFVADLHRATAGNPLFVDGVVRVLIAEGKLGSAKRLDLSGFKLPEGSRGAIRKRLALLSAQAQVLLAVAAVIGQEFESRLLERVSSLAVERLSGLLEEAAAAGIILSLDGSRYGFAHPLIREALYNESGAAERIALHRRIGDALEEIYASDVSPQLAELAHHYQQSRDTDTAIEYSIRAGEAMKKSFAFEEAIAQWQMALELMEKQAVSPERRARHLYALGELCRNVSIEGAVAYMEQAITLFTEAGDLEQAAQAHILAGQFLSTTNFGKRGDANTMNIDRAFLHYRTAERILRGAAATQSLSSLYVGLASASCERLRLRDAITFSRHALELGERLDRPEAWFHAATSVCFSLTANGRMAEARAMIEKMEQKATADDTFAQVLLSLAKSAHYGFSGDPMTAAEWQRRISDWKGVPDHVRASERHSLAFNLATTGHFKEAREIRVKFGLPKLFDAGVARFEGRWLDSESLLDGALEEERATGSRWDIGSVSLMRGKLNRTMGRFEAAEAALLQSIEMMASEHVWFEFSARTELALAYADTGRPALADPHLARCREIVAAEDFRSGAGALARAEGAVAAFTGRSDEADELLARSAAIFQKYQMPFEEAETHIYAGKAALGAGFSARAGKSFDAAVEIYRRIDAGQSWLDRVERERARALAASREFPSSIFRKEGDYWVVGWNGATFRVKDAKGLRYLSSLLHNPGREFHAAELIAISASRVTAFQNQSDAVRAHATASNLGDAGAVLDPKAKAAYKRRLIELRSELEDAERSNDLLRSETLRAEIESITEQIAAAVGLGGRDRLVASHSERARSTATQGIKKTIERIRAQNADLGRHLATSVHTGNFCWYRPDRAIRWSS